MTNTHNTESWREEFEKKFVSENNANQKCWSVLGMRHELVLDFITRLLSQTREESYDKGAMEASMVCNEKTIPQAVKQTREDTLKEVGEMVGEDMEYELRIIYDNPDECHRRKIVNEDRQTINQERQRIRSALTTLSENIKGMK